MKIIRFLYEGRQEYGIVEEGLIYRCKGDPFAGLNRTADTVKPDAVRLLAPGLSAQHHLPGPQLQEARGRGRHGIPAGAPDIP